MILPDTNIWVYLIDARLPEHPAARDWIEGADEEMFLIPAIVQLEVLHYVATRLRTAQSVVMDDVLTFPGETEGLTPAITRGAADSLLDHRDLGLGGRDAAILEHARRKDATVVTHDHALFRAAIRAGLHAHDPVAQDDIPQATPTS